MDKEREALLIKQIHGNNNKEESAQEVETTTEEIDNSATTEQKDSSLTDSSESQKSEQAEETPQSQEETVSADQPTVTDFDWRQEAQKEGYLSPDDLADKYINLEEDPYISKLVELKRQGIDIEDTSFLIEQNVNYDKFDVEIPKDALDLITKELKVNNPDAREDEIRYLVEKEYGALFEQEPKQGEDEFDQDFEVRKRSYQEKRRSAEIESRMKARAAQKALKERQQGMLLPKTEAPTQPTKQEIEAQRKALSSELDGALKDFDTLKVKVGDKDFSLELPQDLRKELKGDLLENVIYQNTAFNKYVNDGNISYSELVEDYLWFNPSTRKQLIGATINQALSMGEEKVAKSLKNAELPTKAAAPDNSGMPNLKGDALKAYQIAQQRKAKK